MPKGSPGCTAAGLGATRGGQEHFSWEGQIWSSSTLNAITVDPMAVRDKHSAVSPPSRNVGRGRAMGEGGSQGERRRREEQRGRWAVGRADGRAGGRVCPPGRCSGRGEGGGPSPATLEATTATSPTDQSQPVLHSVIWGSSLWSGGERSHLR